MSGAPRSGGAVLRCRSTTTGHHAETKNIEEVVMSRKKPTPKAQFVLFNVLYEDGSQTSNRKVPADILGGLDGDEPARAIIEQQDREIAERSGRSRAPIKSLTRAA
jgi:hypothetical protein